MPIRHLIFPMRVSPPSPNTYIFLIPQSIPRKIPVPIISQNKGLHERPGVSVSSSLQPLALSTITLSAFFNHPYDYCLHVIYTGNTFSSCGLYTVFVIPAILNFSSLCSQKFFSSFYMSCLG